MASLTDVALRAGVSVSTASSVLNPGVKRKFVSDAVTARVRDASRELGYVTNYHARSMKLRRANSIGVVLDMPAANATPRSEMGSCYFGTLFGAVALAARHAGFATSIIGPRDGAHATWRGAQAVQQRQLDGVVLLAVLDESHSDSFYIQPPELPLVAIEPSVKTPLPSVYWDIAAAVRQVVEHLAQLGHRQFLWLGPEAPHGTMPPAQRELLFMQTVWDMGLRGQSCRYERHEPHGATTVGETYLDPAREAILRRIKPGERPPFTAIVCYNDTTALGAISALRQLNLRVPEDISVVGFDDAEAVFAVPKLTSVRLPLEEMGTSAFNALLAMIEDPPEITAQRNRRSLLRCELVERQSTGPANA